MNNLIFNNFNAVCLLCVYLLIQIASFTQNYVFCHLATR
jgi:hypothetical protein